MEQPHEVTIQPVKIPGNDDSATRVWQTSSEDNGSPTTNASEQEFLNRPEPTASEPEAVIAAAQSVVAKSPSAASEPKPRRARKKKNSSANDFVIQYDGRFIGTFSPQQKLTSKNAFITIAREMESQMGAQFDPRKLELFRPVPLKFDKPIDEGKTEGTFRWFE